MFSCKTVKFTSFDSQEGEPGWGGGVISHSSAEAIFSLAKSTSPYIGQRVCMMS